MSAAWQWLTDAAQWSGPSGIPQRLWEHALISTYALMIAGLIALPLGVWLGHLRRFGFLAINLGNVGRAVPTFGVLIILASWDVVGVGDLAAVIALAVFAIPPLLTNAYVGVSEVDREVRDAGVGGGMNSVQLMRNVELPLAWPVVAAGVRTAVVQVIATATLAALVGGGGLGRFVVDGFALQDTGQLIGGSLVIAVVCVTCELALSRLGRRPDLPS